MTVSSGKSQGVEVWGQTGWGVIDPDPDPYSNPNPVLTLCPTSG